MGKRRRRLLGAGVVGAAAVAVIMAVVLHSHSHRTSITIPPEQPLASYRLVYRVAVGDTTHEEERDISRPFEGRYVERTGSTITAGFLTRSDGAYTWITSGKAPGWIPALSGPNRATSDQHAAAALAAGQRLGVAQTRGWRTILGRRCLLVRTGRPLGESLIQPTSSDHADLCVDATGVILQETWTRGGKIVRTRTAEAFDPAPAFAPSTFDAEPAGDTSLSPGASVATVKQADPTELASAGFPFRAPAGYTAAGPVFIRETAATSNLPAAIEYVQYLQNGPDLIDEVQGVENGPPSGSAVTLPDGVDGYLTLDMTASSVEVVDSSGRYVRVEGADVSQLLTVAASLQPK